MTMDADGLRSAFTGFFVERGHTPLPPAGLIPHDPSVLFTIAGMVQFKPYFTGEQVSPVPRATTIQPVFRTVDIDLIGTDARHATLFEMLGNFSFGDYFKEKAIPYAWEFVTEVLGFDPERLWVTVHESDQDASGIWQETSGLPAERIQAMGEDNFWRMGPIGPCGPCSEIYFDKGERFGAGGGPAIGGEDRYVEIWNLVFMQYEQTADGTLEDLPKKNIDTGAGLERILTLLQGVDSVFETDVVVPIVEEAARLTRQVPGASERGDVALRILADHARAMTFLVSDGVFPSNEGRGYVLRRVIRRAVLRAHQLAVADLVTPHLVGAAVATLGNAYPKLVRDRSLVETVVSHEEEAFRRTLRAGTSLLEEELGRGGRLLPGDVAFRLHDTFGFPVDLTVELAGEQGVEVDRAGFDEAMAVQRDRARKAGKSGAATDVGNLEAWREVLEQFGPTRFLGYQATTAEGRVLAVERRPDDSDVRSAEGEAPPAGALVLDVVLDATPFYAEGGGQIGDTGTIEGPAGRLRVLDTTRVLDGIIRHTGYLLEGTIEAGEEVGAAVDASRRAAIRRNHTGTHLLHWALRSVLGEHVKQQGSLVAPDRLRFDFSHFAPLTAEELARVDELVNSAILSDEPVRVYETSKSEAERSGAVAFFGDKYGDVVRVVEAGSASVELCGGTHVHALGMIGPLRIVSEASIGANTRRIEATTGTTSLAAVRANEEVLARAAEVLRTTPPEVPSAIDRMVEHERALEDELRELRSAALRDDARRIVADASTSRIVARRDSLDPAELRELALAIRDLPGVEAVALVGIAGPERVALVIASEKGSGVDARAAVGDAARAVGGGGGGSPELATAGGRDVEAVDAALDLLRTALEAS
ncbi:MAG: alanyl-tRNA synthetase [Acidimicrobiaceae bacterium]|nr:alanyl-tRNA synthetase [Acidimicrobiaceae bacterium]